MRAGGTKLPLIRPCVSRDIADVLGVGEKHLEVLFEQVPERLPVNTGRLERDMRASVRREPFGKLEGGIGVEPGCSRGSGSN